MSESREALVAEPILQPDAATLTPDERWARWREKGSRQDARRARIMRLIALFAALALVIGFIWASAPR